MRLQTLIILIVFFTGTHQAFADIIINLVQSGSGVEASWSGAGVADATIDVTTLDFTFSGNPFSVNTSHSMTPGLVITYDSVPNTPYDILNLSGGNTLQLAQSFAGASTLNTGHAYQANLLVGISNLVDNSLNFSDLNVGSYVATTGDASAFGSVRLNIGAATVPEPSHFIFSLSCLAYYISRRKTRECLIPQ